jgi:sec-independent protein translocase protein TatA
VGALEPWHLVVIVAIALIVFGPGKVADIGGTLGKGVKDFREAMDGKTTPASPEPPAPAVTSASADRRCPHCGASTAPDAKFCPQCGAGLASAATTDTRAN